MKIIVNGKPVTLTNPKTLKQFLNDCDSFSQYSAVAINGEFVPKKNYESVQLSENDNIEVLQPAQGG